MDGAKVEVKDLEEYGLYSEKNYKIKQEESCGILNMKANNGFE